MLKVFELNKKFGKTTAVNSISFELGAGEIVGLLGPNGAGKSTTLRLICGYYPVQPGQVKILAHDMATQPLQAKSCLGYLPENNPLYPQMVVADYLLWVAKIRGIKPDLQKTRLKKVVADCELHSVLHKKIFELSKGFKQRVGLAQALIHDPPVLVLDEPTVGLDPNQIVFMREWIRSMGKTVLFSSHILSEVEALCHRVIIIHQGKIIATGTPQELMQQATKNIYQLRIKAQNDNLIRTALHQISGVKTMAFTICDTNVFDVCVTTTESCEELFFDSAVKNDFKLLRLNKQQSSLEDLFANLTQDKK